MKLGDLLTGTWGADPQPDILSAFGVDRRPLASLLKMPEQDALSYGTPAAPTSTSPSTGNPYDLFSDRLPAGRSLADIYDSFSDRVPDDQSGAGLPSSVAVARGDGSNAGPLVQPASFITAQSRANLLQPPEPSRPDNGSLSDPTSTASSAPNPYDLFSDRVPTNGGAPGSTPIVAPARNPYDRFSDPLPDGPPPTGFRESFSGSTPDTRSQTEYRVSTPVGPGAGTEAAPIVQAQALPFPTPLPPPMPVPWSRSPDYSPSSRLPSVPGYFKLFTPLRQYIIEQYERQAVGGGGKEYLRCLSAAAGTPEDWTNFCDSILYPEKNNVVGEGFARNACLAKAHTSATEKTNWCHNQYGKQ
ncbi:hypothetical protein SAMN05519103_05153 [Rhizobiales bacterium GAS113]|nr:hypothetical protein SAMN05519103_05153 [Rhizobiales bacterium GAS113]